jgi:CubicO group peptidase (beta-lactamase class C family)
VKRSYAISLASGFALSPRLAGADEAINAEQRASLTQVIAEASEAPQTVGFSVAISRDGSIAYQAARGSRNLDPKLPATLDTWYCIGSVTKQFTAALVMQLVDAKKLALDDKLATVLPAFPHASEVTLRQLLSHTSGIIDYADAVYTEGLDKEPNVQPAALVALIADKPLMSPPGTLWAYSNTNYLALGLTIEKLYGKPYAQVLHERIAQPLGIAITANTPKGDNVARGYTAAVKPTPVQTADVSWAYAAGEIFATTAGLLAWDRALFSGRVVSRESLTAMTTPVKLSDGHSMDYGFGLFVVTIRGHRIISHSGGLPGFSAQNLVCPEDGIAIATLANTIDFSLALPATKIADVLLPGIDAALETQTKERVAELDDPAVRARARDWLDRLRTGKIDADQLTPQMAQALTPTVLKNAAAYLNAMGAITSFTLGGFQYQGGYRAYIYIATTASTQLKFQFMLDQQNKIAGLLLTP